MDNRALYEIANELRSALEAVEVDEETGELLGQEEVESLEMEFGKKVEGVTCFLKENEAFEDALDAEIKKLQDRKKRVKKQNEWFKNYLKEALITTGNDKFETATCKLSFKMSETTEVECEAKTLPEAYRKMEVVYTPDKTAIKKALKAGEVIEGCRLESHMNLQIK